MAPPQRRRAPDRALLAPPAALGDCGIARLYRRRQSCTGSRAMDRIARCLLCDGEAHRITYPYGTRWNGRDFDYRRCARCGASVLDPLPDEADFARMYSPSGYHDAFYEALTEPTPTALESVARKLRPGG